MCGHKYTSSAVGSGALSSQPLDLAAVVHLVELEDSQLDLLLLVFDLLWCGVVLLLTFFASSPQAKDEVKGRLLLDVVVRESTTIFQLLPGKNQTLLIRWDA